MRSIRVSHLIALFCIFGVLFMCGCKYFLPPTLINNDTTILFARLTFENGHVSEVELRPRVSVSLGKKYVEPVLLEIFYRDDLIHLIDRELFSKMSRTGKGRTLILAISRSSLVPIDVDELEALRSGGHSESVDFRGMANSEREYNQRLRQTHVSFMKLETMFPDPQVRELAKAAARGDLRRIDRLVDEGVDVNARGASGATPLYWAVRNEKGFRRLLELGANPNVVYEDGNSVMIAAVENRNLRILRAVLEHGGDPNLGPDGSMPLVRAVDMKSKDRIDLLLAHGANLNYQNEFGTTPVFGAAILRDFDMVYYLLEQGADYASIDSSGRDLAARIMHLGLMDPEKPADRWQERVIEWLKARGVQFDNQKPSPGP